jgi:hypothetical protein
VILLPGTAFEASEILQVMWDSADKPTKKKKSNKSNFLTIFLL